MQLEGKSVDIGMDDLSENAKPKSYPYEIADVCFGKAKNSGID
jgi:hypothetical protein